MLVSLTYTRESRLREDRLNLSKFNTVTCGGVGVQAKVCLVPKQCLLEWARKGGALEILLCQQEAGSGNQEGLKEREMGSRKHCTSLGITSTCLATLIKYL